MFAESGTAANQMLSRITEEKWRVFQFPQSSYKEIDLTWGGEDYCKSNVLIIMVLWRKRGRKNMKLGESLIKQYEDVINSEENTENQIQSFLEENTIFIPMPFLLNHNLHMNCVISKFRLGNEFITDFAYLKSMFSQPDKALTTPLLHHF